MDDRELWLGATMVELAEALDAEHAEAEQAEADYGLRLVARLAELLAPGEVALLIADDVGQLTVAAASSERARDLAGHEARSGEGPSASCYQAGPAVLNQAIPEGSAPWPRYAAAARAAGFGTVSALPMRRRGRAVGVICVLGAGDYRLPAEEARLARVLAKAAAIAISRQREHRGAERTARQLQRALDSRVVIEQAKGAVAARLGITPEAAFELLRGYARRASRPLADVAGEAVRGELPPPRPVAPRRADRSQAGRSQATAPAQSW
jgi:ANTAR domain/GAF domain